MRFLYTIFIAMLMGLVACGGDDDFVPTLQLKDADGKELAGMALHLAATADEVEFTVESNTSWQVKCESKWLTLTPSSGVGDAKVKLSVGAADASRSAVVTVLLDEYAAQHCSFDVVQWVASPDEPTNPDDPNNPPLGDDDPDDNGGDDPGNGGDDPDDPDDPNGGGNGGNGGNGDDDGNGGNDDNGGNGDDPTGGDDNDDPQPVTPLYGDDGEALNLAAIQQGCYYIGGRRDDVVHLALGEITAQGHCATAQFSFSAEGNPINEEDKVAAVVELQPATEGFYLYFEGYGYLTATSAKAGALSYAEEPVAAWQFAECAEGGFELRQVGDVSAQLIFSQRATQDLLRSIAGDEQGGGVRLFVVSE